MWTCVFHSLGYIPRSTTAGSYGNSMFHFLRNCEIVFHSGCAISPNLGQHLCHYCHQVYVVSPCVFICMSLMANILSILRCLLSIFILSTLYCPFLYYPWRNANADPLPILKTDLIFKAVSGLQKNFTEVRSSHKCCPSQTHAQILLLTLCIRVINLLQLMNELCYIIIN